MLYEVITISNLLARVRNAQMARFDQVDLPSTRILENIASILKDEGFVKSFRVRNNFV